MEKSDPIQSPNEKRGFLVLTTSTDRRFGFPIPTTFEVSQKDGEVALLKIQLTPDLEHALRNLLDIG